MTLQRRTIVFIGVCMIVQLAVLSMVAHVIHKQIFNRLEEQFTKQDVGELRHSIQRDLQTLEREVIDYQNWDEAYDFAGKPSNAFIETHFSPSSMKNIRVDVVLFYDDSGNVILNRAVDTNGHIANVPQSVFDLAKRDAPNAADKSTIPVQLSVARLPEGVLLYSIRPFYHNDASGPARGMGLMGRWLTEQTLADYAASIWMNLELNNGELINDPSGGIELSASGTPINYSTKNIKNESGLTKALITFLDNEKRPVIQIIATRELVLDKSGAISTRILIGVIILLGLVMAALFMGMINNNVLKRMARLASTVREIAASGDSSKRIAMDSRDEIGKLGSDINTLLNKLHESEIVLTNKENQLALMLDQSPLAIAIFDMSGRVLLVNKRYTELSGYTKEELVTLDGLKNLAFPDENVRKAINDKMEANLRIAKEKRTRPEPVEYHLKSKTGELFDVETLMVEAGGHLFRIVNDVTQRNRIMKELKASTAAANEANKAKNLFLANMSHEIRTPLNGISGMAQILAETELSNAQRNCVDTINESCDLLVSVINDILDISKVEAGRLNLTPATVEIRTFINSVNALAGPNILINGLEFLSKVDDNVPAYVICDPNRLKQVLLNMLSNSAKFTDRGQVTLHVGNSGISDGKMKLLFEVTDTGIGISQEDIKWIFEPFFQTDGSHTRMRGGTGLGLTICSKLVQLMDGKISVVSELGKGSTFSFEIKTGIKESSPAKSSMDGRINTELASYCPLKILVAEDNLVNQKVVGMILKKMGYKPDFAFNGLEAVEKEKKKPYDVILMDVQMPIMDGLTASTEIRNSVSNDFQPVIIALTAHGLVEDITKCKQAGMDEHLTKPLNASTLGDALTTAYQRLVSRTSNT